MRRVGGPEEKAPRRRALAGILALAVAVLGPALVRATGGGSLEIVGLLPFGRNVPEHERPILVADPRSHMGFSVSGTNNADLLVYDLARLRYVTTSKAPGLIKSEVRPAVDSVRHRVFFLPRAATVCGLPGLFVLDERTLRWRTRVVPCLGQDGFIIDGMSYYAPTNALVVVGTSYTEWIVKETDPTFAGQRHRIVFRELDADSMALRWEVDGSRVCNNYRNVTAPVVARYQQHVVSYCYVGQQGFSIDIPLVGEKPSKDENGNDVVLASPTYSGRTSPVIDPSTGRLLLLEDTEPLGPAIWVVDPVRGRFVGVIPSGVTQKGHEDYFRGFNDVDGRIYILNIRGIVVADIRGSPLSGGVSFPLLAGGDNGIIGATISVDGALNRLFLPYPKKGGFVVVNDGVPVRRPPPARDLDAATADIAEVAGKTGRVFTGASSAFGVHLLNTGGIARVVDNQDPTCVPGFDATRDEHGRCIADRLVTPGTREFFAAQASLELGSGTGVTAFATGGRFGVNDSASDNNLRAVSNCGADRAPGPAGDPAPAHDAIDSACPKDALRDFGNGSKGPENRGFPIIGALCADFAERPGADERRDAVSSSRVRCDQAAAKATAQADTAAVAVPGIDEPVLSVAHASAAISSELTSNGVLTTVTSVVRGVEIAGQFTIDRIVAEGLTRAHGRSGTTRATFTRAIEGVHGPGIDCTQCDPELVVRAINEALGARVRARLPEAHVQATPRGYLGLVEKDQGLRDSDRAVNDDDTETANALDLIVYTESSIEPTGQAGRAGRSRIIVGLAGVQAESRYGIFLLPEAAESQVLSGPPIVDGTAIVNPGAAPPAGRGSALAPSVEAVRVRSRVSEGARVLLSNPREFGLLFLMWSLLGAPLYLGIKRRSFTRGLR